jgi:hypothetical protein
LQLRDRSTTLLGGIDDRLIGLGQQTLIGGYFDSLVGRPYVLIRFLQDGAEQFARIQPMKWIKQTFDLTHRLPQIAELTR